MTDRKRKTGLRQTDRQRNYMCELVEIIDRRLDGYRFCSLEAVKIYANMNYICCGLYHVFKPAESLYQSLRILNYNLFTSSVGCFISKHAACVEPRKTNFLRRPFWLL